MLKNAENNGGNWLSNPPPLTSNNVGIYVQWAQSTILVETHTKPRRLNKEIHNNVRIKENYSKYYFSNWNTKIVAYYPTWQAQLPVSVYSFNVIIHVKLGNFCKFPLSQRVFEPIPGGQICVFTFYHLSYWYCWLSPLCKLNFGKSYCSLTHVCIDLSNIYILHIMCCSLLWVK